MTIKILVEKRGHANCDSLPLRFGYHFSDDVVLELVQEKLIKLDEKYKDRFIYEAKIKLPNSENLMHGYFVVVDNGKAQSTLVTAWRNDDRDAEYTLSEVIRALRKDGKLTPQDLVKYHPLYLRGEIKKHSDVVELLAKKMSQAEIESIKIMVDQIEENTAKIIAEKNKIQEELATALEMNNILEKKLELESAEKERYQKELALAQSQGKTATLSLPDTLVDVKEHQDYFGSDCTILIMGDGSTKHMKLATWDPTYSVTNKALELKGRRVRTTCWDPIGEEGRWSSKGYFNGIYAIEE